MSSPAGLTKARILVICFARILLFATFMTVAATIPLLMVEWRLSAAAAGAIVSSFTVGYAISLFLFAWASDHFGPKRVVTLSAIAASLMSLMFGLLAQDWWSAMALYALVGLAQGGVYTPLIVLISDEVTVEQRGAAMGWLIASTSGGYAASLGVAAVGIALGGWQTAFILTAILPLFGAVMLIAAVGPLPNRVHSRRPEVAVSDELLRNRESRLLTAGYTAHNWELLGMWAWIPAFLAASYVLRGAESASATMSGAYLSAVLHLFGAIAAFSMGRLSDVTGRRPILIAMAVAGAVMSFSIGWLIHVPSIILVPLVLVYAFVCLGDSPVLTTAISEVVRPGYLGAILAWRGLLGFLSGAMAPIAFGVVFDFSASFGSVAWGLAFCSLGVGGVVAVVCALRLR